MPMVRAMRLLNSIEAGTTSGAQLQTQLQNGGVQSDFNSVLQLPGQMTVMAGSNTAIAAINGSSTATSLTANALPANFALANTPSAVSYMSSSARSLLQSCSAAGPNNWFPKSTFNTTGGSALNNVAVGADPSVGSNGVAFGNGVFVSIPTGADARTINTSTDGVTWTGTANALPAPPTGASWASIAFGNGVFVAISGGSVDSNVAAYSTDGITWTSATLPSSINWTKLAFGTISGTNYFVAISGGTVDSNVTAFSTNGGATWTTGGTLSASARWAGLTFGNGRFFATAGGGQFGSANSTANCSTTNPASNWTAGTALPTSAVWLSVGYTSVSGTDYFVAVSTGTTSTTNMYFTTNNGTSWTSQSSAITTGGILQITGGSGYLIYNGSSAMRFFIPGTGTGTLTPPPSFTVAAQLLTSTSRYMATNGTYFVSMSNSTTRYARTSDITTPTTSTEYYRYGIANFIASCSTFYNGTYYIFGRNGFYSSTDGITWTFTRVPGLGGLAPSSVAVSSTGQFVLLLGLGVTTTGVSAYSSNLVTWGYGFLPTSDAWSSVAYGRISGVDYFVAVSGYQTQTGTSISTSNGAYSIDGGVSWASMPYTAANSFSSVIFINGAFITNAYNTNSGGAISTNGTSWTPMSSTLPAAAWQIAAGTVSGTTYYVTTGGSSVPNTIYYSTGANGPFTSLSLASVLPSGSNNIVACTFANGYFFIAVSNTTGSPQILFATNPTAVANWTVLSNTASSAYNIPSLTYGNGLVIAPNYNSASTSSTLTSVSL